MEIGEFRKQFMEQLRFDAEHKGSAPEAQFISRALELLEDITPEILEKMKELQEQQAVSVVINPKESGLYVKCIIQTETENK